MPKLSCSDALRWSDSCLTLTNYYSLLPNFHNPGTPALLTVKYAKPREGREGEEEGDGKAEKLVRKRERPPTPEPPRYSRRVAADVSEDLKAGSVNFGLALRALRHWLKTGEVSLLHMKADDLWTISAVLSFMQKE